MEKEPKAWEYNWATLSLEDTNTEIWSSRFGVGCKSNKMIVAKSKEVKGGWSTSQHTQEWTNLAESSKNAMAQKVLFCQ
jgi:hypothetical protein